jgi:hypothetical protein
MIVGLFGLVACADRPATAVVAAVAADPGVQGKVSVVRISATRGDEAKFSRQYPISRFTTPGTLTFQDTTDGDSSAPLRVLVEGFAADPGAGDKPLISRSARLSFVREKSKLLRLGLTHDCIGC